MFGIAYHYVTVAEFAAEMGYTRENIYIYLRRKPCVIKHIKVGRTTLIKRKELAYWQKRAELYGRFHTFPKLAKRKRKKTSHGMRPRKD